MNNNISKRADKLVFGTDPEKFAGEHQNGELFVVPPAEFRELGLDFIPDEKHPSFYQNKKDGIEIMEDGVAFEYTLRPSTDWKELFERIQVADRILETEILSRFDICDGRVHTVPTINYDVDKWSKRSEEFQQCLIFGCDTDYDAFKSGAPGKVQNAKFHAFRYGGGHIHVSGVPGFKEDTLFAVQCFALGAGLASVAYSDTPDLDKLRTYLYGRPGKFRPQTYKSTFNGIPYTDFGIEYRTPSNRWTSTIEHAREVFKWAEISVRNLFEEGLGVEILGKFGEDAKKAIVNCNQNMASQILSYMEERI